MDQDTYSTCKCFLFCYIELKAEIKCVLLVILQMNMRISNHLVSRVAKEKFVCRFFSVFKLHPRVSLLGLPICTFQELLNVVCSAITVNVV